MALTNLITSLVLDVYDHDTTPTSVKAIALDKQTRYIKATLTYRGADYPIDENATVTLTVIRPDKTGVQVTGSVVDVDSADRTGTIKGVYAELSQTALAVKGNLKAQFMVSVGEQILRTEIFTIKNGEALDADVSEWAGEYQGYNLDELVQSVNSAVATVGEMESDVSDLKEDLKDIVFDKQLLQNPSTLSANNNTALVNNNDGTYTIGTTDRGNSTFGSRLTLEAGVYYLYGVPNGIAFVSPSGVASSSYSNRIAENTSNELKRFELEETQQLWVCFRSPNQPEASYTITPRLYRKQAIEYDALKFMGVLANGTDLNTVTERGIYFVSSDRTYTNAPLSSGFFIVLTTVTAVQQMFIQYSPALTYTGAVYNRDGGTSGVTTSWKQYGVLNNHNIVFFGDSIMWGKDGSVSALTRTIWQIPQSVSGILGYRTVNYGVVGQAFLPTTDSPATAYNNIASKNLSAYDTLVMCYGISDGFHILGEWDSTDETTVMGQFNKIINYIYTQNPTMRIIVIAPWNGRNIGTYPDYWYGDRDRSPYVSRKVLSDTLKRACDYYWIPYIEQYDSPITPNTITTLLPDGIHPNDDGYKMIGEWVAKKIGGLL